MYNPKKAYALNINAMKILLVYLLSLNLAGAIPIDSSYWLQLNKDHASILRKYIKENEPFGLSRQKTVLLFRVLTPYANPNYHELWVAATEWEDIFLREEPAYVSEIDGFAVAVFIGWDLSSFVSFPKAHSDFMRNYFGAIVQKKPKPKVIYTRRNAKGEILPIPREIDERPLGKYGNWEVRLKKGEKPDIQRTL